ncbi:acyl-coenzyme A synthetase ACSM3, mitochondrial-like [Glandiceps talaboti]
MLTNNICRRFGTIRSKISTPPTNGSTYLRKTVYRVALQRQASILVSTHHVAECRRRDLGIARPCALQVIRWGGLNQTRPCSSAIPGKLKEYHKMIEQFKWEVPEFYNFTRDAIDRWADQEQTGERDPSIPGLWWVNDHGDEVKWTFQDLSDRSKRTAAMLQSLGVKPGDRVNVILHRVPEWWLISLACIRIGAVVCPGSPQLRVSDIEYRLNTSMATTIITDYEHADFVDQVAKSCPSLQNKISVRNINEDIRKRPGWHDFHDLYEKTNDEFQAVNTRSDDPMMIYFTSGTTGKPKMTEHTQASYGIGHEITGRYWMGLKSTDRFYNLADTGWAKAGYSFLFAPWSVGAGVFAHHSPVFDPLHTLETLAKYPITVFCAPATALRMMTQYNLKDYQFPHLRRCVSGGEPVNPVLAQTWTKGTNLPIYEGYGQSETVLIVGTFQMTPQRLGSMGVPGPGFDIRIVDDDGNELPNNEGGLIGIKVKPVRPVGLFTRYINDEERTRNSFRGDYYLTGDKAYRDDHGYFWFISRYDDIISSSGYRIGPFEVESALFEHPAVAESAVVSSPDEVRKEVVKAFIILSADYQGKGDAKLIKELQDHVKVATAPYKYPRKIEFVDELPKTVSGKIQRFILREREWNQSK